MPDHEPGVEGEAALQPVEELPEVLPGPRDALLEGLEGHALHLGHHAADVVGVGCLQGREAEPAVATDDAGDAVPA